MAGYIVILAILIVSLAPLLAWNKDLFPRPSTATGVEVGNWASRGLLIAVSLTTGGLLALVTIATAEFIARRRMDGIEGESQSVAVERLGRIAGALEELGRPGVLVPAQPSVDQAALVGNVRLLNDKQTVTDRELRLKQDELDRAQRVLRDIDDRVRRLESELRGTGRH